MLGSVSNDIYGMPLFMQTASLQACDVSISTELTILFLCVFELLYLKVT